jgi:hypothetical protein
VCCAPARARRTRKCAYARGRAWQPAQQQQHAGKSTCRPHGRSNRLLGVFAACCARAGPLWLLAYWGLWGPNSPISGTPSGVGRPKFAALACQREVCGRGRHSNMLPSPWLPSPWFQHLSGNMVADMIASAPAWLPRGLARRAPCRPPATGRPADKPLSQQCAGWAPVLPLASCMSGGNVRKKTVCCMSAPNCAAHSASSGAQVCPHRGPNRGAGGHI